MNGTLNDESNVPVTAMVNQPGVELGDQNVWLLRQKWYRRNRSSVKGRAGFDQSELELDALVELDR